MSHVLAKVLAFLQLRSVLYKPAKNSALCYLGKLFLVSRNGIRCSALVGIFGNLTFFFFPVGDSFAFVIETGTIVDSSATLDCSSLESPVVLFGESCKVMAELITVFFWK